MGESLRLIHRLKCIPHQRSKIIIIAREPLVAGKIHLFVQHDKMQSENKYTISMHGWKSFYVAGFP